MEVVTRSDLGGAQSVVINLSNSLCKYHEVIVVAGTEGGGQMGQLLYDNVKQESVKWLRRSVSLKNDLLSLVCLWRLYHKYQPDVIHLHSSKVGILGRLVFPKSKIVYTVHGFDSIRLAYRKFLPLERFLQNRCKALVGVCQYDKKNLLEEKITHQVGFVYNGIKTVKIDDNLKLPDECLQYEKIILCIARLSQPKRFDLFLEVADLLHQYAFVWIGNQSDVDTCGHKNVFCLGSIPNAGRYNHLADLFFLPTNYEGLPMVILEAMSLGKPVITSNVGGVNEMVISGWNGYALDNVAEQFADKIRLVLNNEDLYAGFSKHSLELFKQKFTVEKMVEEYLLLYNLKSS